MSCEAIWQYIIAMHCGIDFGFLSRKGPPPKCKIFFISLKGGRNFPNPHTPGVRKWTVTHSASDFWRHHLLDLYAWLVCSRLPAFIRVLKSTFDSQEHDITQFFGKYQTFYGNSGLMMPFIHQTERTNKAVFSAIETILLHCRRPALLWSLKFGGTPTSQLRLFKIHHQFTQRGITELLPTKLWRKYRVGTVFCFLLKTCLLSTCKASDNNFSWTKRTCNICYHISTLLMPSGSNPEV